MLKKGKPIMIVTRQDIMQRASTVLKDVRYCITLHFEMTDKAAAGDNPGKFREMLTRRARKGTMLPSTLLWNQRISCLFPLGRG